ncbi:hypothetical protein, partial [Streptomyces sp. NPDC088554]|uniref:hypothetical protein n=1 Tax=Streptomyces sp. NPDC088554 TaxID=3365865 RepID=UPI00380C970C
MTTALTRLPASAETGPLVLHGRRLRPGASLEATSRFTDGVWRLEDALLQRHAQSLMLDFAALPARYRQTVKHLCYAMLSGPLPPGERRASVNTVHRTFGELKRFLSWADAYVPGPGRPAGVVLAGLQARDLEQYQLHLLATVTSPGVRYSARRAVRFLWRYRHGLPDDGLTLDPRHVEGWGEPSRPKTAENATDRIPEAVLGPLIAWSLRFIDDFGPDILATEEHRRQLYDRRSEGRTSYRTGASDALRELLARHLKESRPLPGHRGRPNMHFLGLLLGCHVKTLEALRPQIDATAAKVGLDAYSWFELPITGQLDGQPWLDGGLRKLPVCGQIPRNLWPRVSPRTARSSPR